MSEYYDWNLCTPKFGYLYLSSGWNLWWKWYLYRRFLLDPLFDQILDNPIDVIASGTRYSWEVQTGMFEKEAKSVTFKIDGADGICIEKVWVINSLFGT